MDPDWKQVNMKLVLIGLVFCAAAVRGQEVTADPSAVKDPSVLRIVSTLIAPYLEIRKVEPEPEVEAEGGPEAESESGNSTTNSPGSITVTSSKASDTSADDDVNSTVTSQTTVAPGPMSPYQGFIPDLMEILLPYLPNITSYEIYTVEGDDTTSAYTNMLKEVISGDADVAAGPMTVTLNKEDHVDFTYPFQRLEATIVMDATLAERIKSLEDLVHQEPNGEHKFVNYGVRKDGAIHKVLQASEDPLLKKTLKHVTDNDVALKRNNADGVNRARYGGYAFILEGSLADWVVGQPPCTLVAVKAGFFKRQYAFAVPQFSDWRDKLNRALIKADSDIDTLREKWLRPGECNAAPYLKQPTLFSSLLLTLATLVLALYM